MKLLHNDQVFFVRIVLEILKEQNSTTQNIKAMLEVGELMKKYTDKDNGLLFDITEYLYEQLRLARGEKGAYDNKDLREQLEYEVRSHRHDSE